MVVSKKGSCYDWCFCDDIIDKLANTHDQNISNKRWSPFENVHAKETYSDIACWIIMSVDCLRTDSVLHRQVEAIKW